MKATPALKKFTPGLQYVINGKLGRFPVLLDVKMIGRRRGKDGKTGQFICNSFVVSLNGVEILAHKYSCPRFHA